MSNAYKLPLKQSWWWWILFKLMKFYFVYVVHEVALKPPNCREITLESDVHDHLALSFACTSWTFLSQELIWGTVFFMHMWQTEHSWCTWLCTDLVWRHQLLIMYQGTTTSLMDVPLSRTTWVSQYQEKTFIGSRPSDHYFRSVCLFVCLFVCAEFFSAVFDPILIKLGHMLYVWV